jgi:hypothetical protein
MNSWRDSGLPAPPADRPEVPLGPHDPRRGLPVVTPQTFLHRVLWLLEEHPPPIIPARPWPNRVDVYPLSVVRNLGSGFQGVLWCGGMRLLRAAEGDTGAPEGGWPPTPWVEPLYHDSFNRCTFVPGPLRTRVVVDLGYGETGAYSYYGPTVHPGTRRGARGTMTTLTSPALGMTTLTSMLKGLEEPGGDQQFLQQAVEGLRKRPVNLHLLLRAVGWGGASLLGSLGLFPIAAGLWFLCGVTTQDVPPTGGPSPRVRGPYPL